MRRALHVAFKFILFDMFYQRNFYANTRILNIKINKKIKGIAQLLVNKNIYYKQSNQLGAVMKRVKNRLLDIRLEKKFKTQTEFAEHIGINRQDYSRIENNKKQVGLLVALEIADKLNIKVDDIFYLDKENESEN